MLQDKLNSYNATQDDIDKLNKKLQSEIMLKQQAVNKLAEIMNRLVLTITALLICVLSFLTVVFLFQKRYECNRKNQKQGFC